MSGVFQLADLFDDGSATLNVDILAADITPTRTKSVFRIQVGLASDARFGVVIKLAGSTNRRLFFRGTDVLRADGIYTFTMGARKPKTYNFQVDATVDLFLLEIEEIEGPVI